MSRTLSYEITIPAPVPGETWTAFRERVEQLAVSLHEHLVSEARRAWDESEYADRPYFSFTYGWGPGPDVFGSTSAFGEAWARGAARADRGRPLEGDLRTLFRQAAKLAHPDLGPAEARDERTALMATINAAYGRADTAELARIIARLEGEAT